MRRPTLGARLLRAWLVKHRGVYSQQRLGEVIDVAQPTVCAWVSGDTRPEDHLREALEVVTGIPRLAWRRPREQRVVDGVRALFGESKTSQHPTPSTHSQDEPSLIEVTTGGSSHSVGAP